MNEPIIILDCGGQYTHLIKSVLRKHGYSSTLLPADSPSKRYEKNTSAVIISGGAGTVHRDLQDFDHHWLDMGIPTLGICFGHQLICKYFDSDVVRHNSEYGEEFLSHNSNDPFLKGISKSTKVWMSHSESVVDLGAELVSLGSSKYDKNSVIRHKQKPIYGVQFHPEVSHTAEGEQMLINFLKKVAHIEPGIPWSPKSFVEETTKSINLIVKKSRVLVGLSGGVDSMTLTALLRKSLFRDQLLAVYIDSGLMENETELQVRNFCTAYDIELLVHDSSNLFFKKLDGVTDPPTKGKIIGELYIREFEKIANKHDVNLFAQGTIWSDVVESGVTKFSSVIKPHHNVGGLPKKMSFKLVEPLRELFKNEVREVASYLKLPQDVVQKKVFPGPGFAIRVDGVVTKEKVEITRRATEIINEVLRKDPNYSQIWMAFAILEMAKSLGVRGDKRYWNDSIIVVRVIESLNSMTVNFSKIAFPYLEEISTRIVNELPVGRVVYDITNKPPGTIEWQ